MNNQGKLDSQEKIASKNLNVIPSGESILEKIGIDLTQIKSIKPPSKRSQYRAIINWLTKYQPNPNTSNLEKVKGLLEVFFHLCGVSDWEKSWGILSTKLNTPTQE